MVVNGSLGQAADPLALVRTPPRCHELLRSLLDLLQRARREAPALRVQLYGCLLQYMQYCRGSRLGACTPVVLEAVIEGWTAAAPGMAAGGGGFQRNGGGGQQLLLLGGAGDGGGCGTPGGHRGAPPTASSVAAASRLDATQDAIERGNAVLLTDQVRRCGILSRTWSTFFLPDSPVRLSPPSFTPLSSPPPLSLPPLQASSLVDLLSRDALDQSAPQLHQALALHLLAALAGPPGGEPQQVWKV